ncbi:MAG: hypothetical protein M3R55_12140 [Acidobacteriota bacterium]|nr:hypothetical protein [Acidobacteriota bacterium]
MARIGPTTNGNIRPVTAAGALATASGAGTLLRMVTGRAAASGNLARFGYFTEFVGSAAELSTTQVKSLLTLLEWSPTFTP